MTENEKMDIFNAGVAEGIKHQKPSEETIRELTELKSEWHEFKSRAFTVLVSACFVLVGYGIWVGTIQARQIRNIDDIALNRQKNESLDERVQKSDISSAELKTRLISIELTLQEIKIAVKRIR